MLCIPSLAIVVLRWMWMPARLGSLCSRMHSYDVRHGFTTAPDPRLGISQQHETSITTPSICHYPDSLRKHSKQCCTIPPLTWSWILLIHVARESVPPRRITFCDTFMSQLYVTSHSFMTTPGSPERDLFNRQNIGQVVHVSVEYDF